MTRRELVRSLGFVSAHALFPSILSGFVLNCANKKIADYSGGFFSDEELKTVIDLIDVVLPATTTKSASQTNTHIFLDEVFAKCLTAEQQQLIKDGLADCISGFQKADDKDRFVRELDKKAYSGDEDYAWFKPLKQYTLIGFFTSQEGMTKASNYVKVPEEYKGEISIDNSTLSYGKTSLHFYL